MSYVLEQIAKNCLMYVFKFRNKPIVRRRIYSQICKTLLIFRHVTGRKHSGKSRLKDPRYTDVLQTPMTFICCLNLGSYFVWLLLVFLVNKANMLHSLFLVCLFLFCTCFGRPRTHHAYQTAIHTE